MIILVGPRLQDSRGVSCTPLRTLLGTGKILVGQFACLRAASPGSGPPTRSRSVAWPELRERANEVNIDETIEVAEPPGGNRPRVVDIWIHCVFDPTDVRKHVKPIAGEATT